MRTGSSMRRPSPSESSKLGGFGVGDQNFLDERGDSVFAILGFVGVDDADAVLVEQFEDVLRGDRIGRPFRQGRVHVVVGERPGLLALVDEGLEDLVVLPVHP